ncbi:hypothetical protein [Longispora albida]|uniref:hypothetical protein n=1 Tax=Longispora albida TaxID=203523 RepID=UPI00037A2D8D|nr:hypothetical protein [Longispora albida]
MTFVDALIGAGILLVIAAFAVLVPATRGRGYPTPGQARRAMRVATHSGPWIVRNFTDGPTQKPGIDVG